MSTPVLDLLRDPSHWAKQFAARKRLGESSVIPCYPLDPDAFCWCLTGAIEKCYSKAEQADVKEHVYNTIGEMGYARTGIDHDGCIQIWNDRRDITHEHVLQLLERAGV